MPPHPWSYGGALDAGHGLLGWAQLAVDGLYWLIDLDDRAFEADRRNLKGHSDVAVDMAHSRWATVTAKTAVDLCTELRAGDQQSFADHDGYRLSVFLTDSKGSVCELDLDHRGHARVEGRIRQGKDCGLANLPFQSFAHNQLWLWLWLVMLAADLVAWIQALCLADDARGWELKRLRYRLLHQSGRIARHARQTTLRLARDWPWSGQLAAAFARLQALPAPTAA